MVALAHLTLELLGPTLPTVTREKALRLLRAGQVEKVIRTDDEILATVRGTELYDVEIFQAEEPGEVDAWCSCTAFMRFGPCKHIYAVALAALNGSDRAVVQDREGPIVRGPHWASRLARMRRGEVTAAARSRSTPRSAPAPSAVHFRVQLTPWSSSAALDVACIDDADLRRAESRRDHRGRTPNPTTSSPTKLLLRGALDRRSLRALRLLSPLEDRNSGYRYGGTRTDVPTAYARTVLRALARTGTAVVLRPGRATTSNSWEVLADAPAHMDPLVDDLGSPYRVEFERLADGGVHRIDAVLVRDGERLAHGDLDRFLCDGTFLLRGRVCRVEWREPEEAAWFEEISDSGAIEVIEDDVDAFDAEVLFGGFVPDTAFPGFEIDRSVPPRPLLVVHEPDGRAHPRADVEFEYDDQRVSRRDPTRVLADAETGKLVGRHISEEREHVGALFDVEHVSPAKGDPDHDARIAPKHLPDAVLTLLERGWAVEVEGRRVRTALESAVRVSTGVDWFDVEGIVDFDGQEAPLPDVVEAVRKKQRFVRLESGDVGVIPGSFDDGWGLLEHLGRKKGTGLRFARSQGWLIDALLSARGAVRGDDEFEALRGRVAAFDGIEDHAEPSGFVGTLRPYQRRALGWFEFLRQFGLGGCLADDMGLGKTVQVLALLVERQNAGITRPSLVVAPRSVVGNWVREARRFAPGLRVVEYAGRDRAALLDVPQDVDVVAMSYGVMRRDLERLVEIEFDYVVLDEAQMVKNPSSNGSKAARSLVASHRLALTGTPVENRLTDLWAILEFACPGLLGSSNAFRGLVRATSVDHDQRAQLATAIRPVLLRRTKELVAPELPARTEQDILCELPKPQRGLYEQLKTHYRSRLLAGRAPKSGAPGISGPERMQILEALLRLRQAACHGLQAGGGADPALSGKLDELLPMLVEATDEGHKALVFSQFTKFLACVRTRLDEAGIRYLYLDGKTRKRDEVTRKFQEDDDARVFLISLKAGGVGLNLTAADYVFLLDPWWNPAVERQAIDRAHRIGRTRPVVAYRMIAADTIEERILDLQREKRELAAAIVDGNASLAADLSREDLERLLA